MDSLQDRVAIVTGASSGIGRACAQALGDAGAKVVLVGRNIERLNDVGAALSVESLTIAGDIAEPGFSAKIVSGTLERFGKVDIVLSNAGLYFPGDFASADLGAVRELFNVNVFGAFAIVREALPHMIAAGTGDVIMTSSISGHQVIPGEPVYSASKHAVQAFTHEVRRQLAGSGVRIGEIAPGTVLTELWGVVEKAEVESGVQEGRGIRAEDVADAALYMLTRPRHVTIRDLVILPASQKI